LSFDVCGAAEHEFLACENVAFDGSIYLRDRYLDYGFSNFGSSADDERPVLRDHIPGEVTIDSQHRFELHFASEIHHVAHETKPIIFVYTGLMAINEPGLAAFVSARNCLSSHWLLPFYFVPLFKSGWGVAADKYRRRGAAVPLLKKL
jgi:hypothetical protein